MSSVGDVISQHNAHYHQYADDMQLAFASCQVWNVVPVMYHDDSLRICCFWTLWRLKLRFLAQVSGCPKSTAHKASTSKELVYSSLMSPTLHSTLSWPDHPASQVTFPHGPSLFPHLISKTLYHHTFAMQTKYQPLNVK